MSMSQDSITQYLCSPQKHLIFVSLGSGATTVSSAQLAGTWEALNAYSFSPRGSG